MKTKISDTQLAGPLLIFVFYLILGTYPVLGFLWRRSYPFMAAEIFVIFSVIVTLSLLLTALHSHVRPSVMVLLTSLLIAIVCLIQFNLQMEGLLALVVVITPLAWVLKSRFHLLGIPVLAAMLVGAWADSLQHPDNLERTVAGNSVESGKPPVIHILLDGFIGMAGLPAYPASSIFKEEVNRFLQEYGFKNFPRAYSRYPLTGSSLYAAMNFRNDGNNKFSREAQSRQRHVLTFNSYFDVLEQSGYRFNIYQTGHLNFCHSNPESLEKCWNYVHPNVQTVRQVPSVARRAGMLAKVLVGQSFLLTKATYGLITDPAIAVHDPQPLKNLQQDVLASPEDRVFFAHLLIPHNPFVYLHDCSVKYESNPSLSYAMLSTDRDLSSEVIEYRTMRYFEQAECALFSLRQLFEAMKSKAIFDQSHIIIHGDHGSQISRTYPALQNLDILTVEDYRAHYSTLFAVKLPFGKFDLDTRALPLSTLLEEFGGVVSRNLQDQLTNATVQERVLQDEIKTAPFIYVTSPNGLQKVDVDIFD